MGAGAGASLVVVGLGSGLGVVVGLGSAAGVVVGLGAGSGVVVGTALVVVGSGLGVVTGLGVVVGTTTVGEGAAFSAALEVGRGLQRLPSALFLTEIWAASRGATLATRAARPRWLRAAWGVEIAETEAARERRRTKDLKDMADCRKDCGGWVLLYTDISFNFIDGLVDVC